MTDERQLKFMMHDMEIYESFPVEGLMRTHVSFSFLLDPFMQRNFTIFETAKDKVGGEIS